MSRGRWFAVIALVAALALPATVFAAGMRHMGGRPGRHRGLALAWDRAKEVTIRGTVVEPPALAPGLMMGAAMQVRTEAGATRVVRLGPPWYVTEIGLKPAAGNTVEVVGLPLKTDNTEEIIAREVIWDRATYTLRGEDGAPLWARGLSEEGQRYSQLWDRGRKETVTGTIRSVEEVYPAGREAGAGVVLRLNTRQGRQVQIHLGPAWFVEEHLPGLKAGQEVTVNGSDVKYNNEDVLIAATVQRGRETVRLRNDEGLPEWGGGWRNWGGWGPGSQYGRLYNPAAVETITGRITKVEQVAPMRRAGQGLGIIVRTGRGREVSVHLGPAWYLEQVRLSPKVGDEVTVTGAMAKMDGAPLMLASTITWHDQRVELRAPDGRPLWMGRGMAMR